MTRRTIAEMSIDTRLIMERLDKANIGDVVTYAELSQIIGRNLKTVYHFTATARKRLLKEKKYFQAVPGVGFKRCDDSEKVATGGSYLQRSRRACRRGARITTSVDDYDAMSKGDKVRHNAQLSLLLTMQSISTPRKLKAITQRVADTEQKLTIKSTIEAIVGSKKSEQKKKVNGTSGVKLPVEIK